MNRNSITPDSSESFLPAGYTVDKVVVAAKPTNVAYEGGSGPAICVCGVEDGIKYHWIDFVKTGAMLLVFGVIFFLGMSQIIELISFGHSLVDILTSRYGVFLVATLFIVIQWFKRQPKMVRWYEQQGHAKHCAQRRAMIESFAIRRDGLGHQLYGHPGYLMMQMLTTEGQQRKSLID